MLIISWGRASAQKTYSQCQISNIPLTWELRKLLTNQRLLNNVQAPLRLRATMALVATLQTELRQAVRQGPCARQRLFAESLSADSASGD